MAESQENQLVESKLVESSPLIPVETFFADAVHDNDVYTNIDLQGRDGLVRQMKVTSKCDIEGESLSEEPFAFSHFYAHVVYPMDAATGEVQRCVRVVLMSPGGQTTSFTSGGVIDSLDMIRRSLGDGPYDPPLMVKLARIKTRHKRTIFRLEVLPEPTADATPANRSRAAK